MSVQDCTHCGDWRTTLRSHFPPDVLWDPGTKLRLTGLCTGTGTQQATLLAPKLSFFSQDNSFHLFSNYVHV